MLVLVWLDFPPLLFGKLLAGLLTGRRRNMVSDMVFACCHFFCNRVGTQRALDSYADLGALVVMMVA